LVLDSVTSAPQCIRQPRPRVYLKEGTYHTRLFNDTRIERERERERYRERVYYNDNPSQDEDQERLSKVTCHITIKLLTHHPTASLLPCGSKRMRSCWKRVFRDCGQSAKARRRPTNIFTRGSFFVVIWNSIVRRLNKSI
jgi:hypothetical protein